MSLAPSPVEDNFTITVEYRGEVIATYHTPLAVIFSLIENRHNLTWFTSKVANHTIQFIWWAGWLKGYILSLDLPKSLKEPLDSVFHMLDAMVDHARVLEKEHKQPIKRIPYFVPRYPILNWDTTRPMKNPYP